MAQKIAILGGGVSGVVLANELSKSEGIDVDLFEQQPILGGLQKSVTLDGLNYDIGTFILPGWHEVFVSFPWLKELCVPREFAPQTVRVSGRLDKYPITLRGYAADFGYLRTLMDVASILPAKIRYFKKRTLTEHVQYYIGRRIYVNSGLKHYIERLYQLEDNKIDIAFATQRLQHLNGFSLRHMVKVKAVKAIRIFLTSPTLDPVDQANYVRPKNGFGALYGEIENKLVQQGVRVFKERKIESIKRLKDGFEIDGIRYDRVISTIPIPTLAKYLALPLKAQFECINLVSLFYRFRGNAGFTSTVLFNYSLDARWKRLTMFSSYYGKAENGDEYFTVECISGNASSGDPASENIEWLRKDFEEHTRSLGLFQGSLTFQGSVITRNAYPVFRVSEMTNISKAKADIEALGIGMIGRQGAFEFLSSAQSAAGGRRFAKGILTGSD
jgi:protoporphyrinogen oxidase